MQTEDLKYLVPFYVECKAVVNSYAIPELANSIIKELKKRKIEVGNNFKAEEHEEGVLLTFFNTEVEIYAKAVRGDREGVVSTGFYLTILIDGKSKGRWFVAHSVKDKSDDFFSVLIDELEEKLKNNSEVKAVKESYDPHYDVGINTSYEAVMHDLWIQLNFKAPVRDYVQRFMEDWGDSIEEVAQLSMCLNHMIWNTYANIPEAAKEFDAEWKKLNDLVYEGNKYTEAEKSIYWELLD